MKLNIFYCTGQRVFTEGQKKGIQEKNLQPTFKRSGGSVMILGFMSTARLGNIHMIDVIMNQYKYLQTLKVNIKVGAQKLSMNDLFHFY